MSELTAEEAPPTSEVSYYFGVLGPLELRVGNRQIPLGGGRQQIMLTMLLLEANHVVCMTRLVDGIWNSNPPASAVGQVRICASALRRILAGAGLGDPIETATAGYRLRLPPGASDLAMFQGLSAKGRAAASTDPQRAVKWLREALLLWRGSLGVGLDSDILQIAATKLKEEKLAVVELLFDLQLQLGQSGAVVAELTRHQAENPFREKLTALLMTALYRSNRQAEALSVFQSTRRRYVEDLGIEPSAALRELEQQILIGDPELGSTVRAGETGGLLDSDVAARLAELERENERLRGQFSRLLRLMERMPERGPDINK
jgi:DNA-binding SARP family transcriptional activator